MKFARNRVRHELLPQLTAAWNPQLTAALAHLADLSYEEERWWAGPASPVAAIGQECRAGGIELRADELANAPRSVARRAIRRAIVRAKGDLRQIQFDHVERVLDLVSLEAGEGRIVLPGVEIRRSFDWIRLAVPGNKLNLGPIELTIPGSYAAPDGNSLLRLEVADGSAWKEESAPSVKIPGEPDGPGSRRACATLRTVVLGLNRIPGELHLRGWRPGDRYRPTGDTRVRKVAEMFAKARIPSWQRPEWPIIMSGTGIVWARRFGVAAEFAAEGQSDRVLRISEEILSN